MPTSQTAHLGIGELQSLVQCRGMELYTTAVAIGLIGGWLLGAIVTSRGRVLALCAWLTLPIVIYAALGVGGFALGGWNDPSATKFWWLLGLVFLLGKPILIFLLTSVLGFTLATFVWPKL